MIESFNKEPLKIFDLLVKEPKKFARGVYWTLDPSTLRFKHGEDIAELKVPYHLGGDDEDVVAKGVYSMGLLLKKRFEEDLGRNVIEDIPSHLSVEFSKPLKARSFKVSFLMADTIERRAAEEILHSTPLVDGEVLTNWLSKDAHGYALMAWFTALIDKVLREEASTDSGERTSFMALLGVINSVKRHKDRLKDLRIKGVSYSKLDMAVGFSIYGLFKCALRALLERLRETNVPYYSTESELILKTALKPRAFLGISSGLLATSLNPYGIDGKVFDALSAIAPKADAIADGDVSSEQIISSMAKAIDSNKDLTGIVKLQHNIKSLRAFAMDYLINFDLPAVDGHKLLYECCHEDRLAANIFTDQSAAERLSKALTDIRDKYVRDKPRVESLDKILGLIAASMKGKRRWFKGGEENIRETYASIARSFFSCWMADHVEKFCASMRMHMIDRRGSFDNAMLIEEYKRGTLYRFSTDTRPVLTTLAVAEEGQLFIDMKDFTMKTFKVKEIAMAEMMKESFYSPILAAASRYATGSGVMDNDTGIRLNSMPGDAALFSGSVSMLISLAHDIQKVISLYKEKLDKALPPVKEELLLEDINKKFETQQAVIKKNKVVLLKAIEKGDKESKLKLNKLKEEEHRMETRYRDALEAAINRELEAGLFISYGAKAENLLLEAKAGLCEPMKVAIGEKINEAARGTDRNSAIRAKFEMMLEGERVKRRHHALSYPFDVYVDKTFSLRVPPDLEISIKKIIERKDEVRAKALATTIGSECYKDLRRFFKGASVSTLRMFAYASGIYNKGQALSEEALNAYKKETKGTKLFFNKKLAVSELNRGVSDDFYFPFQTLNFCVGVEVKKGLRMLEVFLKIGDVVFKGFERKAPTVVYEILNQEGKFFKALDEHHLKGWIEAAEKNRHSR